MWPTQEVERIPKEILGLINNKMASKVRYMLAENSKGCICLRLAVASVLTILSSRGTKLQYLTLYEVTIGRFRKLTIYDTSYCLILLMLIIIEVCFESLL